MKRFLSAVALCVSLLLFGLFALSPAARAEKNLLEMLLNLPAPPPPNPLVVNTGKNRPEDFFNKNKPPGDDAPIDDLMAYWQAMSQFNTKFTYTPDLSERAFERIRGEVEKDPELLPGLLNSMPETSEAVNFVRNLYDREMSDKKLGEDWHYSVKAWLTYHSDYFSDELVKLAEKAADTGEYVSNQDELLALARVDWDKARPILDRLYNDNNQPVAQTLARWAFYSRAVREKNSSDIEKYRKELQETVENKSALPGNRDLAMDALVTAGDFEGRDEWYLSLLEDETLHDLRVGGTSYTGLTTLLNHSPSDKYTAKMLELVRSDNPAVRSAAVRNLSTLLDEKNPEIVRALLPWLENPKWARETNNERRRLVGALHQFQMPESVPGLIAVLNEKQTANESPRTNANMAVTTNSNSMPGDVSASVVDYYPLRSEAVGALAAQKDIRAISPLRLTLPEVESWQRGQVVRAILMSGGFSVSEQIEALELVAKDYMQDMAETLMAGSMANVSGTPPIPGIPTETEIRRQMSNTMVGNTIDRSFDPSEIKPLLGMQLMEQTDAEDALVTALIARIGNLDTSDPLLASALRKIMQNWNGAAVNRLLLSDLKNNKADTDAVVKLLSLRKQLRENQLNEVFDLRGGTPTALGISACLLEDAGGYDSILASDNTEAKTAMLGCARLIRARLPVRKAAENLRNPNKMLALAAERYLESEDSPEARQIVLSLHPNQAKILGARTHFTADEKGESSSTFLSALFASVNDSIPSETYYLYSGSTGEFIATEKRLRKEVRENQELIGVYAYDNNFVRIYKDKAVFSWQTDKARYRERILRTEEFDNLKSYLAAERVNELPPFLSECVEGCNGKELLMLGRQGGRRVFNLSEPNPKFFAGLETIFENMRQPPAKLHYWLEKNIAGLEILFEDENQQAEAVWKTGDDFRVLINNEARRKQIDKEIEEQEAAELEKLTETSDADSYEQYQKLEEASRRRREQREYENFAWYKFADGRFAGTTAQPNGIEILPKQDGLAIRAEPSQWKARTAAFELRANGEGLYKITGRRATKMREGYFEKLLVTANGRWLVASKYDPEIGRILTRINLLTNREYPIKFEEYPLSEAVAFIPSLNRVLLFASSDYEGYESEVTDSTQRNGAYYFLDVETGTIQKAKGEVRPLGQQTFRPLQPTGQPDEVWAAIPDAEKNETQVGVYNLKTLAFKSLIKIPEIEFDSMQMWVDAGKIYFVYQGHLLGLPLPK